MVFGGTPSSPYMGVASDAEGEIDSALFGFPGHVPARRGDLARLVEHAALGAGEGKGPVGVDLAALQPLPARSRPHHVVAAILVDGHAPFWPSRRAAVASPPVDPNENGRVEDREVPLKTLLRWSEALAAIARTGLGFTESLYERERFEEILKVAADIRVEADGPGDDPDHAGGIVEEWMSLVGKGVPGYVTPKVAVGAAVGNDRGELLLIQRADSGIWLYPTGWCDVGYSAAEVVVKEVEEETGIEVEPVRLIAVLDGLRLGARGLPFYSLVFHCRAIGGALQPHPLEVRQAGWFAEDALPEPLAGSGYWKQMAFDAIRGERFDVLFDLPR